MGRDYDCAENLWCRLGAVYRLHRRGVGFGGLERRETNGRVGTQGRSCEWDGFLVVENRGCGRLGVIVVLMLYRRLLFFEEGDWRNREVQQGRLRRRGVGFGALERRENHGRVGT